MFSFIRPPTPTIPHSLLLGLPSLRSLPLAIKFIFDAAHEKRKRRAASFDAADSTSRVGSFPDAGCRVSRCRGHGRRAWAAGGLPERRDRWRRRHAATTLGPGGGCARRSLRRLFLSPGGSIRGCGASPSRRLCTWMRQSALPAAAAPRPQSSGPGPAFPPSLPLSPTRGLFVKPLSPPVDAFLNLRQP